MTDATAVNRARWDELAALHGQDDCYDVEGFLAGRSTLGPRERAEISAAFGTVGTVDGADILHLQCHFGLDTLSLARLGARVTGLDFSPAAIERARALARAAGIAARFVQADAQHLPGDLAARFDLVYASFGVLCWIADVHAWMRSAATALRPAGRLVLLDIHPLMQMVDAVDPPALSFPYLGGKPQLYHSTSSYASSTGHLRATATVEYPHGIGEIVTAAAEAGLRVDTLTEYLDGDRPHGRQELMTRNEDGRWQLVVGGQPIPVEYALRATRI